MQKQILIFVAIIGMALSVPIETQDTVTQFNGFKFHMVNYFTLPF